jgi:pyridoxal phosphate enzyme (YggS family)
VSSIAENFERIRAAAASAAARARRAPQSFALVAVSKTQPPEAIFQALDAGQLIFGESRVQEARAKIPLLPASLRWHFIGHLQSNKVRQALSLPIDLFHGVDSLSLAADLDRVASELGLHPKILLEVNVSSEASKFGFQPADLRHNFETLLSLQRVEIEGLMTIPPPAPSGQLSRPHFAALRELRDQLQSEFSVPLPTLSMGMSSDFETAIEEGATLIRVGSALFGDREGSGWRPAIPQSIVH